MILNDDNTIVIISNRLVDGTGPMLEQGMVVGQLMLADALIIGNCNNQVRRLLRDVHQNEYLRNIGVVHLIGIFFKSLNIVCAMDWSKLKYLITLL